MTSPATVEPMSLPATIMVLLTGRVSRVSRVLFSFSFPMDDITMLPIITIMSMTISGTNIICLLRAP